ncbi:hypothetical protein KW783_04120 [Candidatus Parcubacteria bacterium]|nr:hypothetical protein [Candidatus Parcubacteria bacterium]
MKNSKYIRQTQYKKGFIVPLIILIIAVLVGSGGYVAYKTNKAQKAAQSIQSSAKDQNKNSTADTSSWKTYTNAKYGFELKFPPSWGTEITGDYERNWTKDPYDQFRLLEFGTMNLPSNQTIFSLWIITKQQYSEYMKNQSQHTEIVIAQNNNYVYLYIPVSNYPDNKKTFATDVPKILSTFKFTSPQADTSGWKTYTNTKEDLSFKYPADVFTTVKETDLWFGSGVTGTLSVKINPQPFDPTNIQGMYGKIENAVPVSFSGGTGYKYQWGDAGCFAKIIERAVGQKTIRVTFGSCEGDKNFIADDTEFQTKFLSTFNFISPQVDTSSWKTYTNSKYGFELKFPFLYKKVETNNPNYDQFMYCSGITALGDEGIEKCSGTEYRIGVTVLSAKFEKDEINKLFQSAPILSDGTAAIAPLNINGHDFYVYKHSEYAYNGWFVRSVLGNNTLDIDFSGNAYVLVPNGKLPTPEEEKRITAVLSTFKLTN